MVNVDKNGDNGKCIYWAWYIVYYAGHSYEDMRGGDIDMRGGDIDIRGGDIDMRGGDIDMRGGDVILMIRLLMYKSFLYLFIYILT